MNLKHVAFVLLTIISICAKAQEPIDLFSDEPRLSADFIRVACWNLQHFKLQSGGAALLPGSNEEEDMAILVKTYAKAIDDLGLDLVALVEHQRLPGATADRLAELVDELNDGNTGPWRSDDTQIEYDNPQSVFGNLQFALLWNSTKIQINPDDDQLLEELRQPRDDNGNLISKGQRAPWLIPVRAGNLEFDLIVLHLKSGGGFPQADEVNALEDFIRERQQLDPPRHLIVLGDWNLRPDNSTQRNRLRKMAVPTNGTNLMRILTIEEINPSLDGWEELGRFTSENAVAGLVPYSHFNNNPPTIDTLLDHIAISRTFDEIFDHPIRVTFIGGGTDVRPGFYIARPVLLEADYLKLTDHIPVVLTLRTTHGTVIVEPAPVGLRIVAAIPNPLGDDVQNEEVTIRNDSDEDISLEGWRIVDAAGQAWPLVAGDGPVPARGTISVVRNGRPAFLNNEGAETISLVNPAGETIDERTYNGAVSGQIIEF